MTDHTASLTRIGCGGHIAGHDVLITPDDRIVLCTDPQQPRTYQVPNHGTPLWELANRPGFRLGWVRLEDDAETLYFYDRDDDNFGYALNLDYEAGSERGYAPFARA